MLVAQTCFSVASVCVLELRNFSIELEKVTQIGYLLTSCLSALLVKPKCKFSQRKEMKGLFTRARVAFYPGLNHRGG